MKDVDVAALKMRIEAVLPTLNEYQRRRYLSAEAKSIGYGGITLVSRLSGVSRPTLTAGVKELNSADVEIHKPGRSRKPGGGRKPIVESSPGILDALSELLEAHTKGDPMRLLLWTNKSLRNLSAALADKGYSASRETVSHLLKRLGYGLQADKKTLTAKPSHSDRDAQFEHINDEAKKAVANGNPVLSIDAKKKEKIGNFKNNGQTYQPHKTPIESLDHDFLIPELGKATPFGVYDIFKNKGFVNVGLSSDTATFAVESIRKWWYAEGAADYASAEKIVLTADCGGSNGNRSRLWKFELQKLANEINKDIQMLHYPPGTSKWNKIEHRMFAFISKNWQGIPLISAAIIVNLIGATKTTKGLSIRCVLDEQTYEKGMKVTDEEFDSINIKKDDFHGEWNYTICHYMYES
jgi:hypothetical protein